MSYIINIIKGKCPDCEKGDIFISKGNPLLFRMPKMHKKCTCCQHSFIKEPGYFFGAMYVSYALSMAEMIAVFVLCKLILGMNSIPVFLIVLVIALFSSTINFRLSRTIWIYIFSKRKTDRPIRT
ncbi:DUF983 domain-containing protein [Sinomicrobium soli]|uniref:DUF983 domain-containing protein n=1 Tax=Sinomicrobium sp. N-1-3-6 TaxID=2219864 RepID=UPI000DCEC683|nr:DUF983 domain-containing protein [Sinomicrobium sp. N-1-3-6]RAV30572.1 DUF983 domain-containing protein [Sinomicrobium sp. N-1-3-6]